MKLTDIEFVKVNPIGNIKRIMSLKSAARRIREHNRIHYAAERNSFIITDILECCAQILEQIDEKKIRYERYGQWIPVPQTDITKDWVCSNCQGVITVAYFCKECYYDYCPHCGANMKGK